MVALIKSSVGLEFPSEDSLELIVNLIKSIHLPIFNDVDDFESFKKEILQKILGKVDPLMIMEVGIVALKAFVQECWTGPPTGTGNLNLPNMNCLLENDGEHVYSLVPFPIFLILALAVFESDLVLHYKNLAWWKMRAYFIHQKLLENPTGSLYDLIMNQVDQISINESTEKQDRFLTTRYHLELGMIYHYYKNDNKAKEHFEAAQKASQFKWSVTGYLGKRTKFQTFDVSQLAVVAQSMVVDQSKSISMPQNLDLNDDTLLESINFSNADEMAEKMLQGSLHAIDQCILLAFWYFFISLIIASILKILIQLTD